VAHLSLPGGATGKITASMSLPVQVKYWSKLVKKTGQNWPNAGRMPVER
jgi:hypothetical protein